MDEHQIRIWRRMIEALDNYETGVVDLQKLASDLKGLLAATDLHDQNLTAEFWDHFVEIDMELELRTEAWAPSGSASDQRLRDAVDGYRRWVETVLATTDELRT